MSPDIEAQKILWACELRALVFPTEANLASLRAVQAHWRKVTGQAPPLSPPIH